MTALTSADADYIYSGGSTPLSYWVFPAPGGSPAFADVRTVLARRAARQSSFRLRVGAIPTLAFPRWVNDSTPPDERIYEAHASTWGEAVDWMTAEADTPIDPTSEPWRLFVIRDVHVPAVGGPATIVVIHYTHALADGLLWNQVTQRLFTDEPSDDPLPRSGASRWDILGTAVEVARIPLDFLKLIRTMRSARGAALLPPIDEDSLTRRRERFTRWIRVLVLDQDAVKFPNATVTSVLLWRTAAAIESVAGKEQLTLANKTISVPLSLDPSPKRTAANTVLCCPVDVGLGAGEHPGRLDEISAALKSVADEVRGPGSELIARFRDAVPAVAMRNQQPGSTMPVTVSGYRRVGALSLLGQGCAFTGMTVGRESNNLTVRAAGYGNRVTVNISGSYETISDPDAFCAAWVRGLRAHV